MIIARAALNQGRKSHMKWISVGLIAPLALAILVLTMSAPVFSSGAYAGAMSGTPSCSDRTCKGINSSHTGKNSHRKPTQH
jgi:hypothetical protein